MRLIHLAVFLTLTLVPLAAEAQQAGKLWRMGYLAEGPQLTNPARPIAPFHEALRELDRSGRGAYEGQMSNQRRAGLR